MVFSLVSSAQEWLNVRWDEHKKEIENRELEKKKLVEEAERVILNWMLGFSHYLDVM